VELPRQAERSSSTALLLITIIVVGVFLLSFFNVQGANDANRRALEERATTFAAAIDTNLIQNLSGAPTDADTQTYRTLKSRLLALKQINSDVKSVYLAGIKGDQVFFYVDSEQSDSQYFSAPGEAYDEATPTFKNMFYSAPHPLVEGPVTDKFGTWVSGLAPIFNPDNGRVLAVVGVDVDAISYNQSLLGALDLPLGIGLILLAVVGVYEWRRRHDEQQTRMRSELVSIASHELRSPLTGMRWAIEGLLKSVTNKAEETKLKAIQDSIIHLQAGTEDILQFTAVTGTKKLNLAPVDMRALMQEICDTQAMVAQQKSVKLTIDDSWPKQLMITCDADRMKRALHNMVSNAIKYTRDKTEVVISYKHTEKQHQMSISDHGIGIPKQEQQRVFGGFYRASNAKASGVKGTGLGLYLTRKILEQHKGQVGFISEEGKGTTFVLSLPV
jgi:signal transduction histidine kinase